MTTKHECYVATFINRHGKRGRLEVESTKKRAERQIRRALIHLVMECGGRVLYIRKEYRDAET